MEAIRPLEEVYKGQLATPATLNRRNEVITA